MIAFSPLAKAVVEHAITECDNPADRKDRIMQAREAGIFSDQEAADWLAIYEVQAA